MIVELHIECDNAAFELYPENEVARILHELADQVERYGIQRYNLRDVNGYEVGYFQIERENI